MFSKTVTTVCAALVLAAAFGSVAQAQSNSADWWRTARNQHCVSGEQSTISAYPSWLVCTPRAGGL